MRSRSLTSMLAGACLMVSTPGYAQLRYEAGRIERCETVAKTAACEIYQAQKLKLDQRFYSQSLRRVNANAVYQSALRDLESSRTRNEADLSAKCQTHFRGRKSPWRYEWAY